MTLYGTQLVGSDRQEKVSGTENGFLPRICPKLVPDTLSVAVAEAEIGERRKDMNKSLNAVLRVKLVKQ